MSEKLLKNVDWIIPVPDKANLKNKLINSTQFSIEHNGNITKWKLMHNFNDHDTKRFGAYLKSLFPQSYGFNIKFTFMVRNWTNGKFSKGSRRGQSNIQIFQKVDVIEGLELLTHEELFAEENNYIKDGKLHLIVVIKELPLIWKPLLTNIFRSPVKKMIENSQFDEVFKAMTSDGETITLQTADGVKLKALKQIIGKKSPVFGAMFETDMVEKSQGFVEIIDFNGKVMEEMLRFMYFGKVHSIKNVDMELYNAAKVYQVKGLAKICLTSIKSRINLSNVFKIVEFAHVHDETDLFETCCELICRFFADRSIREKMKELGDKIRIRVLTESLLKSRCNSAVFCTVETEEKK